MIKINIINIMWYAPEYSTGFLREGLGLVQNMKLDWSFKVRPGISKKKSNYPVKA
jgi:hypothetical protein